MQARWKANIFYTIAVGSNDLRTVIHGTYCTSDYQQQTNGHSRAIGMFVNIYIYVTLKHVLYLRHTMASTDHAQKWFCWFFHSPEGQSIYMQICRTLDN